MRKYDSGAKTQSISKKLTFPEGIFPLGRIIKIMKIYKATII